MGLIFVATLAPHHSTLSLFHLLEKWAANPGASPFSPLFLFQGFPTVQPFHPKGVPEHALSLGSTEKLQSVEPS